jgi:hypothetical protein
MSCLGLTVPMSDTALNKPHRGCTGIPTSKLIPVSPPVLRAGRKRKGETIQRFIACENAYMGTQPSFRERTSTDQSFILLLEKGNDK